MGTISAVIVDYNCCPLTRPAPIAIIEHYQTQGVIMTNEDEENDNIKSIGFGYDRSEIDPDDCELLNLIIAGYLTGYLRAKGDSYKARFQSYDRDNYVFYIEEHPMGVKDLFALRRVLPEELRNHVRLYKIATRMVPEVFAMAIGDIEMGEMKEE